MQIGHLIAGIDRRCEPGSIYRIDEFGKGAAMTGSDAVDGDVFDINGIIGADTSKQSRAPI